MKLKKFALIALALATCQASLATANTDVVMKTTAGDIEIKLFDDKAPQTVKNFIGLATGSKEWVDPISGKNMKGKPLYNGTIFHRVIPGFMIQGGDPMGNGMGGPKGAGFPFKDEFNPSLSFNKAGLLAMANSGKNTNASQFFITVKETPWLDNRHTIFGEVTKGMDVVNKIITAPTGEMDRPTSPVSITSIEVKKGGPAKAKKKHS